MPEAYASVEDVRSFGGAFTTSMTDDAIEEVVRLSCQRIDSVTRNHFGKTLITAVLSGDNTPFLKLGTLINYPLVEVQSIHFRENYQKTYDWEASGELIDADTYDVYEDRLSIIRITGDIRSRNKYYDFVWRKDYKNYRVKAYIGWESVPEPIRWVTVLLARETILPGSSRKYMLPLSERFPDGYQVFNRSTVGKDATNTGTRLLGIPYLDDILSPFARNFPLFHRV